MGTAVAVAEQRGVMSINIATVNYASASSMVDRYLNSVGGSGGGAKNFPGKQIGFKQGVWSKGFGDKAQRLKNPKFVVNGPNVIATWMKWEENGDKKKPVYAEPRWPAAGDTPVERADLGDTDQDEWETDKQGNPQDPWKPVLVFPVRDVDGEEIDHIFLATKSAVIAGFNLFRDIMDEMKMHTGQLPVVALTADKAEMTKTSTDAKGRAKKEKFAWDIPVFEIIDWVKAEDCDNPAKGGVKVTSTDDADLGEVSSKSRKAVTKKDEPKQIAKGKQSRRQVEVDDDEI